jgi:hypothetical protein
MSDNAWDDLLVVQLFRGGGNGEGRSNGRRRRGGWLARWWRGVVRGFRWRGVRGAQTSEYRSFMASDAWSAQRYRVLRRDGYRCRWCSGRGREVHHTVYPPPGAPVAAFVAIPDSTLVTLCEPCHRAAHRTTKRAPKTLGAYGRW